MPQPLHDAPRPVKDVLTELAVRIQTIEGALKLLRANREVELYDPIPPFK